VRAQRAATEASIAFPPFISISAPAKLAKGWLEATIPKLETASRLRNEKDKLFILHHLCFNPIIRLRTAKKPFSRLTKQLPLTRFDLPFPYQRYQRQFHDCLDIKAYSY
jgi:hypothetical protein